MDNNENNGLDMNQPKTENEYYVTKLEKYEELNKYENKQIFRIAVASFLSLYLIIVGLKLDEMPDALLISSLGAFGQSVLVAAQVYTIAKKAGLESRINAIKEKLELLDLQNNQNNDNQEEKGRNR